MSKEFDDKLMDCMNDEKHNDAVSVLISYNTGENKRAIEIPYNCKFTTKALYRLGFKWPMVSEEYIEKSLTSLRTLGYFD